MSIAADKARRPPGPSGLKGLAAVLDFKRDPFSTLAGFRKDYGDLCLLQAGRKKLFFCFHPDDVERVLMDGGRNYARSEQIFPWFRAIMGDGVLTSKREEDHRHYREALLSILGPETIEEMSEITIAETDRLLERWKEGERANVIERMEVLALRVLIKLLLGRDLDESEEESLMRKFRIVFDYPYERMVDWIPLPMAVPTPGWFRFRRALKDVDSFLRDSVARVREGKVPDGAARRIVSKLAECGKNDADPRFVDHQLMSLFFTAISATATLLGWTFLLLDGHPEIEKELRGAPAAKNKTSAFAAQVLRESLRLYPPVWILGRQAVSRGLLSGHAIEPGDSVFVSPWVTHRHSEFWEDPSAFKPSRFLPEASASRHRFSFFPFSVGHMQCMGGAFAMTQANIVLSRVVGRRSLKVLPGQDLEPSFGFKLRPKNGLWVESVRHG